MLAHRIRLVPAVLGVVLTLATVVGPASVRAPGTGAAAADRTVDVAYTAVASNMQRLLDRCDGPVAVTFDGIRQRLLAEHDYCGGRWVLGLDRGDVVRIEGGNIGGRYRAGEIKVVRKGSSAGVLRGMGAVVAQTCRPDGDTLRLVGLSRID